MRQTVGSRGPRAYAAAMTGLWLDLRVTLANLDALAAEPDDLDADALPALQNELHVATELLAGLEPPEGAEALHEELQDALVDAREATAEMCEALAVAGPDGAAPLVWEWRGALFRVRFARMRLDLVRDAAATGQVAASSAIAPRTPPAATAGVVALGSALVLAAALLGLWLLVGLTLAATLAASVLLRP